MRKSTLFFLPVLIAVSVDASAERLPLFQTDDVLKAVLTAPIAQTYAQRHQDVRLYFPGQWTYIGENGEPQRLQVSIRTRGNFRREYCQLPPLQLNFKKSEVKGTLFAGQNKLKLVAPCREGERYQQYVVLEYLAYRTLEILTEYSFSTRLIRLSYVDSDDKLDPWTDIVFVIEDDSDLAKRVGLDRIKIDKVAYKSLDHPKAAVAQLFQLLIANNDYSFLRPSRDDNCCHNVQILGDKESDTGRIPVSFDFDMSGLVNAGYAAPPSQVPIRDVRVRYFYGLCQPEDILNDAIAYMQSKREDILALYANSAELSDKMKEKSLAYIEEFYAILDSPEAIQSEIVSHCRGSALMQEMIEASKDST